MSVTVQIVGLEKLQGKLAHVPNVIKPMLEAAAEYGQKRMRDYAKPHAADKGTLAEGVEIALSAGGAPLSARVGFLGSGQGARSSLANLAVTVNYGRGPGKPPTFKAIQRWLKSHGYQSGGGYVRQVQKAIAAQGTKGVEFVEHAEGDLIKELPKIVAKAAAQIEKEWAK